MDAPLGLLLLKNGLHLTQDDRLKAEFGKEVRLKGIRNNSSVRNCDSPSPLVLSLQSKFPLHSFSLYTLPLNCFCFPFKTSVSILSNQHLSWHLRSNKKTGVRQNYWKCSTCLFETITGSIVCSGQCTAFAFAIAPAKAVT